MARARGIPASARGGSDIAPLKQRRITRATLAKVFAFQIMDEREVTRYNPKTRKREKTGETEERESIKLCFYWDSHDFQRDRDGELIYDEDTGETKPHYLVDGYVTLSPHAKSNLVSRVLSALGFSGSEYFVADGKHKGNMTDDFASSLEAVFGGNALGEDFSQIDDWADLPFYERGGQVRKGEMEVEVTSLKLGGYELIGRQVDLQISIDDNNGFNTIDAYMIPADFESLDSEPKEQKELPEAASTANPGYVTPPGLSKHAHYVVSTLVGAKVAPIYHEPVVRFLLSDDSIHSIEDISVAAAKQFRALVIGQEHPEEFLREALAAVEANDQEASDDDWLPEEDLPF